MNKGNMNEVILRLVYALNDYKDKNSTTLILGAGCSLTSTDNDVTTIGVMKQCLLEHQIPIGDESNWEKIYELFSNIVWNGKTESEKRALLNKRFQNMKPTRGHRIIKALLEKGYVHNIITTNFDMLIENTCEDLSFSKRVGDEEYYNIGKKQPMFNLLKVHGDLESGKLRFSPSELKKLPDNLEKDINQKTKGLTLFLGYRGQDIGLMNSINTSNSSSIYWVNISGPLDQEYFEAEQINELLSSRESMANVIDGKEYGDFQNFLNTINEFLIAQSHPNIIDTEKSKIVGRWEKTSILDMLSQNYKMYVLFSNLMYISEKQSSKHYSSNNYLLYLDAYLFFFKSDILPSKLITIPHNEINALMLGIAIEIIIRTQINRININRYIDRLRVWFEDEYNNNIILDTSFWDAIKNLINLNFHATTNTVKIKFGNQKLYMESVEIPLENLKELMQIIRILSSVNLPYEENNMYRAFSGKNKNFGKLGNKIYIDLGEINDKEKAFVTDYWIENLPEKNVVIESKQIVIYSKWLEISFKSDHDTTYEINSIYDHCLIRCKKTTKQFLSLGSITKEKHEKLNLDIALSNFINSEKVAMFIVGYSGYGKTSALKNYIRENSDYFYIAISSKNYNIEKCGLSLFLDINDQEYDEDILLQSLNTVFEQRNSMLIMILDGVNEFSFANQEINYIKAVELSEKLYKLNCKNIKLIITCRTHAYNQYKESTGLHLNPLYFYNDKIKKNKTISQNDDASYSLHLLDSKEIDLLFKCYIPSNVTITDYNLLPNATPLYFAILGEYLENNTDVHFVLKRDCDFYEIFSKAMFDRLSKTNVFWAKQIIYTYFDLIVRYNTINVTYFMVENEIVSNFHLKETNILNSIFNELMDINILVYDPLENQKIRFIHDKIEEFFFAHYLEESVVLNNIIIDQIMSLAKNYLIYRSSFIQYLVNKAKYNLSEFKDIIITHSFKNMDILPRMGIKALSYLNDLKKVFNFLFHEQDYRKSKTFLNIIIFGLEESLLSYSLESSDLMYIINTIMNLSSFIVSEETKSYMYFFKSRLFYFENNYEEALSAINDSLNLANNSNEMLRKISIHKAVILLEMGYSKDSIDILQTEYEKCKENEIQNKVRIGVELGRALNHSGQIEKPLQVYDEIYQYKDQISNSYLLARIYGEKANILNKKMFKVLNFGFIPVSEISTKDLDNVNMWFKEIVSLFKNSIELLEKDNDVFCYSGTVPELINTYIAYSISVKATGIDECEMLIQKLDILFKGITTPYKTDFNLAKAYYYEYLGNFTEAEKLINMAKECSIELKNKFKEAKCNIFYSQFAYRRILSASDDEDILYWKNLTKDCADAAYEYYKKYTSKENNRNFEICEEMKNLLINT